MKNFKKIGALLFLSAYLIIATPVFADDVQFKPQIGIPGSEFQQGVGTEVGTTTASVVTSDLLARYIAAFYKWGLSIVGVLAILMLMAGGIVWLTSGGDSGRIANAKKMIEGSLFGSLLLLGAYFFLNTINPDLTKLPAIKMDLIKRIDNGCCQDGSFGSVKTSDKCKGTFMASAYLNAAGTCETKVCCIYEKSGTGSGCFDSTSSVCTGSGLTKNSQSCYDLAACKDKIITCDGKQNGDDAIGFWTGYRDLFCYYGLIVTGPGKVGEACGSKSNNRAGVCVKNSEDCNDTNQTGGRDCVSGAKCCIDNGASGSW